MKEKEIIQLKINNLAEMQTFANKVAEYAMIGDVITLSGNLGVGKTSFTQFFVNYLSDLKIEVTSPTFNLLQIYEVKDKEIWHFDLYRLKSTEEVYEIGIEDALNNSISIIEWPEIILDILPENRLEINLTFADSDQSRIIQCKVSDKWKNLLLDIKASIQ